MSRLFVFAALGILSVNAMAQPAVAQLVRYGRPRSTREMLYRATSPQLVYSAAMRDGPPPGNGGASLKNLSSLTGAVWGVNPRILAAQLERAAGVLPGSVIETGLVPNGAVVQTDRVRITARMMPEGGRIDKRGDVDDDIKIYVLADTPATADRIAGEVRDQLRTQILQYTRRRTEHNKQTEFNVDPDTDDRFVEATFNSNDPFGINLVSLYRSHLRDAIAEALSRDAINNADVIVLDNSNDQIAIDANEKRGFPTKYRIVAEPSGADLKTLRFTVRMTYPGAFQNGTPTSVATHVCEALLKKVKR